MVKIQSPVRSEPREVIDPTEFGIEVSKSTVYRVKEELIAHLSSQNFCVIGYKPDTMNGIDAVAYSRFGKDDGLRFREEDILLDDGGNVINELPVLKIAIRNTDSNKQLTEVVSDLFKKHGIDIEASKVEMPSSSTTDVYALKRV